MLRLQRVEHFLIVREHAGDGLAGQQAAVDLDGAGVGHEVHLHAAVDHADIDRRRAEQGMRARGEATVIFLQRENHARHVRDRVHAEVRLPAVRGFAPHDDAPAQHALAGDDGTQARGLRDERGVRGESCAKLDHAAIGKLLVHHRREPDFARRLEVVRGQ